VEESFRSLSGRWKHFEEKYRFVEDHWNQLTSEKIKAECFSALTRSGGIETIGFRSTRVVDLVVEFRCFRIQEVKKAVTQSREFQTLIHEVPD
jgi:hypothetical protein